MPKAGNYEYPARDLDDCLKYLKKAHDNSQALITKRETFGKDVGLSPRGGGFGVLIGSMTMFGLVETGYGDIRYTELAQKILFGKSEEQEESKNQAVRNVKLFHEIFERYGSDPTSDQLRHILREKASVPISVEARVAAEVGNSFKRNTKYFKNRGETKKMQRVPSTGSGLFTVTAEGLTIEVDNLMKLGLVEQLIKDARNKLAHNESSQNLKDEEDDSNHIKGKKDSNEPT